MEWRAVRELKRSFVYWVVILLVGYLFHCVCACVWSALQIMLRTLVEHTKAIRRRRLWQAEWNSWASGLRDRDWVEGLGTERIEECQPARQPHVGFDGNVDSMSNCQWAVGAGPEKERGREGGAGQATVASAAQCPELKWRRRYKKGVKKFYFLCSYYDLMDVYDTKKQQKKKNQIAFYALFTLLLSPSSSPLLLPHTHSLCFSCLTSDAYKSKQPAKWAAAASTRLRLRLPLGVWSTPQHGLFD